MGYLKSLLCIPLAASLLVAPACRRERGEYAAEKSAQDAGPRAAARRIDLDNIAFPRGINVISRHRNPSSSKYAVVVLESHPRLDNGMIDFDAMIDQPVLYRAGVSLVEAGFRSVGDETALEGASLEEYVNAMQEQDRSADFSGLLAARNPEDAKTLVAKEYFGNGYENSWLLGLTYKGRVRYMGAATTDMLERQIFYSSTLLNIERFVSSGLLERFKGLHRRNPRDGEAAKTLAEFNGAVDYLSRDYDWFMNGRTRETLGPLMEKTDNLIFFTGTTHFKAADVYLSSTGADGMVICAGCTREDALEIENGLRTRVTAELPGLKADIAGGRR